MITPKVIIPSVAEGFAVRQMGLGTDSYDLTEPYPPDTGIWQSRVLDLGSPKFQPNRTYAFDRSRYNNHGTITGATWTRLSSGLWGLSFDGTDDNVITQNPAIGMPTGNTNRTVELWVYPTIDMSNKTWVQWGATGTQAFMFLFYTNNADGSVAVATWGNDCTFTQDIALNTWSHAVLTLSSGTSVTCYINAGTPNTQTLGVACNTQASAVYLGERSDGAWDFSGSIALLRIYNVVLNAAQIAGHFNRERHLFGI